MPNYKLKEGFSHYEGGSAKPSSAGTVVSMSARRAHSLRDRFELVEDRPEPIKVEAPPEPEVADESDESGHAEWVREFSTYSAKEARDTAAIIDEVDVLYALLGAESRTTVVAAIEERLEAISG